MPSTIPGQLDSPSILEFIEEAKVTEINLNVYAQGHEYGAPLLHYGLFTRLDFKTFIAILSFFNPQGTFENDALIGNPQQSQSSVLSCCRNQANLANHVVYHLTVGFIMLETVFSLF